MESAELISLLLMVVVVVIVAVLIIMRMMMIGIGMMKAMVKMNNSGFNKDSTCVVHSTKMTSTFYHWVD